MSWTLSWLLAICAIPCLSLQKQPKTRVRSQTGTGHITIYILSVLSIPGAGLEGRRSGRSVRGRGGRSTSRLGTDARCTVTKRRGGTTGGKTGRRKAARPQSSEDEDGGDSDDSEERYLAEWRGAARRRLEPMLVE